MIEVSLSRKQTRDCVLLENDYLMGVEKQLSDKKIYEEVSNSENILSKLAEMTVFKKPIISGKIVRGF